MRAAWLLALVGCWYTPHTFVSHGQPFRGVRHTLGCIELALTTRDEPRVAGTVIDYSFGNVCSRDVDIDFGSVRAIGRDASGRDVELRPYDPRAVLHARSVDALASFRVAIEYRTPITQPLESICIEIGELVPESSSGARWVCAATKQEVVRDHARGCKGPVIVGYCDYGNFHLAGYLALEVGPTRLAVTDPPVTSARARTTTGGPAIDYGGQLRILAGGGPIYGGFGAAIAAAPRSRIDIDLFAGLKVPVGPMELSGELGAVSRTVFLEGEGRSEWVYSAGASAGWWLCPYATVGVRAATTIGHAGDTMMGAFIGLHVWPYDGRRGHGR